jgi:bZIP transcription factor
VDGGIAAAVAAAEEAVKHHDESEEDAKVRKRKERLEQNRIRYVPSSTICTGGSCFSSARRVLCDCSWSTFARLLLFSFIMSHGSSCRSCCFHYPHSARESRKRKKTMIEELQRTVITLSRENKDLNERNEQLRRQLIDIGGKVSRHFSFSCFHVC